MQTATPTRTKRGKAPPPPTVKEAMKAAIAVDEQKALAARAEVLNTLHDTEQELEAFEDLVIARDAEISTLQAALDKAMERRQQDGYHVVTLRAKVNALSRKLDREHGNDMLNAAISELAVQDQLLRDQAKAMEAQKEPVRDRFGEVMLMQTDEGEANIEAIYIRMEKLTVDMNELANLTREPITPTEIRSRIAEIYTGQGMPLAA